MNSTYDDGWATGLARPAIYRHRDELKLCGAALGGAGRWKAAAPNGHELYIYSEL